MLLDIKSIKEYAKKINIPLVSSRWATRARGSTWFIVFTVSMATFTDIFLYGIIVPVVPFAFQQRMGVPADQVQSKISQNLAIYSAGLIVGSLLFGYICDKYKNRRMPMIAGLVVLVASTVILCLTKTMPLFMVGRLLLGLSAGVVWTVGLAIVADTAPPEKIAYLMGFPGIGMSLGVFLGPLLGGVVYNQAGYYAVWYVCFGVLGLDIVLRFLMIETKHLPRKMEKFKLSTSDEEMIHQAQVQVGNTEEENNKRAATASGEKAKTKNTLFGRKLPTFAVLLKSIQLWNCLLQTMVIAWLMTSLDTVMTIHLNEVFGFDSQSAGLVFLGIAVPSFLEPAAGWLADRFGPRAIVTVGFILVGVFVILLRLPDHHSTQQVVLFVAMLALAGLSLACIFSPMVGELTNITAKIEAKVPGQFGHGKGFGQAYGLFNVAFSLGALIGPFISGAVMDAKGWDRTTLALGIVALVTAIPAVLFTGGNLLVRKKDNTESSEQEQEPKQEEQEQASSPTDATQVRESTVGESN